MNPKKIAVICNYRLLPERVGGMDYFFWMFDQKCKENGIEVNWFFPNMSRHGGYEALMIFESGEHIESYFLNSLKENPHEYSHIITHFVELCIPFFYKIKKLSNVKVIAVDHNPRPLYGYTLKKKIEKKVKGILFSRFIDLFIGVSDYTTKAIIADFGWHFKNKTRTIYNGVLIDHILTRQKRNIIHPTFLVTSHLRESKGIQDLIEAVYSLTAEVKQKIRIDLYGDGPYKEVLEHKINKRELQHVFRFMGSKSNLNEIFYLYDYMLQPTHMECFSLSILESLAANVPVITTNVGGNEEVVSNGENGFIYKAKDISSLRSLIENVYSGKQKIEINTRSLIEKDFSLQKMVTNYLEILENK